MQNFIVKNLFLCEIGIVGTLLSTQQLRIHFLFLGFWLFIDSFDKNWSSTCVYENHIPVLVYSKYWCTLWNDSIKSIYNTVFWRNIYTVNINISKIHVGQGLLGVYDATLLWQWHMCCGVCTHAHMCLCVCGVLDKLKRQDRH